MDTLAWLDDSLVRLHDVVFRCCRLDLESHRTTRALTHYREACHVLAGGSVVELELSVIWEQSNKASSVKLRARALLKRVPVHFESSWISNYNEF